MRVIPCPFCGATPVTAADVIGDGEYGDEKPFQATCPTCAARGPRDDTPEGAAARWDTRWAVAPTPQHGSRVARWGRR